MILHLICAVDQLIDKSHFNHQQLFAGDGILRCHEAPASHHQGS